MNRTPAAVLLLGLAVSSAAVLARTPSISVQDAWSRATMSTDIGGVYLTIINHGAADDVVGAETPLATKVQLHQMTMDGNVMQMRPIADLPIPANQTITLDPDGIHIMLTGMTHPLRRGETFPITVRFSHAGAVTTTVHVAGPGAIGPAAGGSGSAAPAQTPGMSPNMNMRMPMTHGG